MMDLEKILPREFYKRSSEIVAKELLGKLLVRRLGNQLIVGMIIETEAYLPFIDEAAHSFKGKTPRTEVLFGECGFTYIYSIHGKNCMDITCDEINVPGSVLIRALEPIEGIELMREFRNKENLKDLASGPGKLCQAMNIDRSLNKVDVTDFKSEIFIIENKNPYSEEVRVGKRIGVTKAKEELLRFRI